MIIIYYRHIDTGEILDVHLARPGQTMADLEPMVEDYNSKGLRIAAAVEVADDSLEAYLFKKRNERANIDREALQEAIDAMYMALDRVRYLQED